MGFSESIFQKEIYQLTEQDLSLFFSTEQEETSILEFKSGEVGLESIYREVAAFLNTEGGLLIVGSPKEKLIKTSSGEKKVCQGELTPSKIQSQDNLLRSIASNVAPAPHGLKAKEIEFSQGKIFILEIPQSVTPPHQVSNEGKYYIRLEREAKPAPHGIVEALFYKRQKPSLEVEIHFYKKEDPFFTIVDLMFSNNSLVTAEHTGFIIKLDAVTKVESAYNFQKKIEVDNDGQIKVQENLINSILVKGIHVPFTIEAVLKYRLTLFQLTYWCKDIQAESKIGIYDAEKKDFVKTYSSTTSNSEEELDELFQYFNQERAKEKAILEKVFKHDHYKYGGK